MIQPVRGAVLVLASLLCTAPVAAHHSGALYNSDESKTLVGTVKEFQWTNPHCWIQLSVTGATGVEEWSIEMGAPLQLYQGGWRPGTLKIGDEITVLVHPAHDAALKGGLFVSATRASGETIGAQP
jgi:hypothetical protein